MAVIPFSRERAASCRMWKIVDVTFPLCSCQLDFATGTHPLMRPDEPKVDLVVRAADPQPRTPLLRQPSQILCEHHPSLHISVVLPNGTVEPIRPFLQFHQVVVLKRRHAAWASTVFVDDIPLPPREPFLLPPLVLDHSLLEDGLLVSAKGLSGEVVGELPTLDTLTFERRDVNLGLVLTVDPVVGSQGSRTQVDVAVRIL